MEGEKLSPLGLAIERDDADEVERLVRADPDGLKMETGVGTLLHYAAQLRAINTVKRLVAMGLDVNVTKYPGYPEYPEGPLWNAVSAGSAELVQWLLEQGAKSNALIPSTGEVRNLPLVQSVEDNRLDIVRLLVQYGADVNVHFADQAPLSVAEACGHTEMAEFLRSKGALTLKEIKAQAKSKGKRKK